MARGRFVSRSITLSRQVHELRDDTSRLAFTWALTFVDRECRWYADPDVVKSILFPRRHDITVEDMAAMIEDWAQHKLIVLYEVDGERFMWFPKFRKHQAGMRLEREAPSIIPPPPANIGVKPELVRQDDGVTPPELHHNDGVTPPEDGLDQKSADSRSESTNSSMPELGRSDDGVTPPIDGVTPTLSQVKSKSSLRLREESSQVKGADPSSVPKCSDSEKPRFIVPPHDDSSLSFQGTGGLTDPDVARPAGISGALLDQFEDLGFKPVQSDVNAFAELELKTKGYNSTRLCQLMREIDARARASGKPPKHAAYFVKSIIEELNS